MSFGGGGQGSKPLPPPLKSISKYRLAFFQKGLDSFLDIRAGKAEREQFNFQGAAGGKVNVSAPVDGLLGGFQGHTPFLGQGLGNFPGLL